MLSLLSNLTFMYPFYALLGILALAGFYYAYRKAELKKKKTFASNIILKKLKHKKTLAKKFKPPLRIILELLIAALLLLGLTNPVSIKPESKMAIIIDNSLSMAALENNQDRLSLAKSFAKSYDHTHDYYQLLPEFKKIDYQQINDIPLMFSPQNLSAAISQIKKEDYSKIILISDQSLTETGSLELKKVNSSKPADNQNLAITKIASKQGILTTEIKSYALQAVNPKLILFELKPDNSYEK